MKEARCPYLGKRETQEWWLPHFCLIFDFSPGMRLQERLADRMPHCACPCPAEAAYRYGPWPSGRRVPQGPGQAARLSEPEKRPNHAGQRSPAWRASRGAAAYANAIRMHAINPCNIHAFATHHSQRFKRYTTWLGKRVAGSGHSVWFNTWECTSIVRSQKPGQSFGFLLSQQWLRLASWKRCPAVILCPA